MPEIKRTGETMSENEKPPSITANPNAVWKEQLKKRITSLEDVAKYVNLTVSEKRAIGYSKGRLKMAITPYFAGLMDKNNPNCPIRKQAIPSVEEFQTSVHELSDPCGEEHDTVAPGLVHRYPDRVLFLVTDACAMYCRHCTRRRIVGSSEAALTDENLEAAAAYIGAHKEIRDVLISGGDPLLLPDERLDEILTKLRAIPHVEIIRIGTRAPVTIPQRITANLCDTLKKHHPIFMSLHFNHPKEITPDVRAACSMLADAGIPLGSQTVLLKGINDKPAAMSELMQKLLAIRVRPYYIYQCDLAPGTDHFRTPLGSGIRIIEAMRGHTSGYAVPTFVIDAPGGGGKIPIAPEYVISKNKKAVILKNFQGKVFVYPQQSGTAPSEEELNL
ncbi:MAG: KamA family radical SAM protein, partial [Endomicrobiia bacterium]|nr:KamA family radical SAM protein [Endomicrobiia bacterium]